MPDADDLLRRMRTMSIEAALALSASHNSDVHKLLVMLDRARIPTEIYQAFAGNLVVVLPGIAVFVFAPNGHLASVESHQVGQDVRPSARDRRRLADGAAALVLPEPHSSEERKRQLDQIGDAIAAMQSLDDLGSPEANNAADRDLQTLRQRARQLVEADEGKPLDQITRKPDLILVTRVFGDGDGDDVVLGVKDWRWLESVGGEVERATIVVAPELEQAARERWPDVPVLSRESADP